MTLLRAPYISLSWPASALGANFGGYNVYRTPARAYGATPEKIAAITVPAGFTAATVEAQHNAFRDYEAGWAITSGQWADGYNYFATSVDARSGIESLITGAAAFLAKSTADTNPWLTSNLAPMLNFPIGIADVIKSSGAPIVTSYDVAGRDLGVSFTDLELPPRTFSLEATFYDRIGEDVLRPWRAAASSGLPMCLLTPRGDRSIGGLDNPSDTPHGPMGVLTTKGTHYETSGRGNVGPQVADYNLPAGVVLNGSSQYISVPDNALINPGAGAFSIVVIGAFANAGSSRYALSKGTIAGAANGYALRTNGVANQLEYFVRGAGGNGAVTATSAAMFDGTVHAAIVTDSGTAQALYLDDSTTPAATGAIARGAVTNAIAMAIGADNAGASSFMALAPGVLVAYYGRVLTPTEAQNAARAGFGYAGYRLPANPALLLDLRDTRTWPGYGTALTDISSVPPVLAGALAGTPATRGIPSAYWATLDKFS